MNQAIVAKRREHAIETHWVDKLQIMRNRNTPLCRTAKGSFDPPPQSPLWGGGIFPVKNDSDFQRVKDIFLAFGRLPYGGAMGGRNETRQINKLRTILATKNSSH